MVRLEGLRQLKNQSTSSSGLEPATFRLVAQCRNQLHYRVPFYVMILLVLSNHHFMAINAFRLKRA
jgi:hypothetical protein